MPPEALQAGVIGAGAGLMLGPTVRSLFQNEHRRNMYDSLHFVGPIGLGVIAAFATHDMSPFFLSLGYSVFANPLFNPPRRQ